MASAKAIISVTSYLPYFTHIVGPVLLGPQNNRQESVKLPLIHLLLNNRQESVKLPIQVLGNNRQERVKLPIQVLGN